MPLKSKLFMLPVILFFPITIQQLYYLLGNLQRYIIRDFLADNCLCSNFGVVCPSRMNDKFLHHLTIWPKRRTFSFNTLQNFKRCFFSREVGPCANAYQSTTEASPTKTRLPNLPAKLWKSPSFARGWYQFQHLGKNRVQTDSVTIRCKIYLYGKNGIAMTSFYEL